MPFPAATQEEVTGERTLERSFHYIFWSAREVSKERRNEGEGHSLKRVQDGTSRVWKRDKNLVTLRGQSVL